MRYNHFVQVGIIANEPFSDDDEKTYLVGTATTRRLTELDECPVPADLYRDEVGIAAAGEATGPIDRETRRTVGGCSKERIRLESRHLARSEWGNGTAIRFASYRGRQRRSGRASEGGSQQGEGEKTEPRQ